MITFSKMFLVPNVATKLVFSLREKVSKPYGERLSVKCC